MKILYWTIRILGMILLSPVVIVAIPGSIFYFISEELETYVDFRKSKNHIIKNN